MTNARFIHCLFGAVLLIGSVSASVAQADVFLIDPQYGVTVTSNVIYGTSPNGAGVQLQRRLDVYEPVGADLPSKLPGVVLMHGGYYVDGSKGSMSDAAYAFASRGYVATSINYRLLSELAEAPGSLPATDPGRYPGWMEGRLATWGVTLEQYFNTIAAATADEAMAVNWLADNADSYHVDSSKIVIGGFSAGAVSSLLLAYGAVEGAEADVAAVVPFAGGMFGTESAIGSDDPPAFIVHGTDDDVIPFAEVGHLQAALSSANIEHAALIVPGGGHSTFFNSTTQAAMFGFLQTQLVPEPSALLLLTIGCGAFALKRRRRNLARLATSFS